MNLNSLPLEIINLIMSFIRYDCKDFLKYLKTNHYVKYLEIITSIDKKIKCKYEIFNAIDYAYHNIETINNKTEYMEIKKVFYNYHSFEINVIIYKLLKLYIENLQENKKKKFANLCANNYKSGIYDLSRIRYEPKIELKKINIYLDNYINIKKDLIGL